MSRIVSRSWDYVQDHTRGVVLTAGAAVVALGGGIAVGALTAGSSPAPAAAAPASGSTSTTPTSVPSVPAVSGAAGTGAAGTGAAGTGAAGTAGHVGAKGVRGQVTAIGTTTWTVVTARGQTVTVDIGASTKFGPKVAPGKVAVGDEVVVVGARNGSTVEATRIGAARAPAAGSAGSAGSTGSAGSSTTSPPAAAGGA